MNRSRRLHPVVTPFVALLAALALAGCGGSSGSDDAAAPAAGGGSSATPAGDDDAGSGSDTTAPDPCSLLDAADLSSAYGLEFADGTPKDSEVANQNAGLRGCEYTTDGGSYLLQVTSSDALGSDVDTLFDQSVDLYPDATDGGVGDKSLLLPDDAGFLAVSGDVFVQGNLVAFGVDGTQGGGKSVLETVVGNLD